MVAILLLTAPTASEPQALSSSLPTTNMDFHLVPRGEDRNYTGFLTKTIVYTATLIVFIACKRQSSNSKRYFRDPPVTVMR